MSHTSILSVSLPTRMTKTIDELARATEQNRSELVRHALREYIADVDDDRKRFVTAYRATRQEKTTTLSSLKKQMGLA